MNHCKHYMTQKLSTEVGLTKECFVVENLSQAAQRHKLSYEQQRRWWYISLVSIPG